MNLGTAGRTITVWTILSVLAVIEVVAQVAPYERTFPQPKERIESALKQMQSSASGHLPVLDGFANEGDRPLDKFQRGFYQCSVRVAPSKSGGSVVQISAKITAWYSDPTGSKSGYEVLPSNGRLETDFLDRLQDLLGVKASAAVVPSGPKSTSHPGTPSPSISAPSPQEVVPGQPIASSKAASDTSSPFKLGASGDQPSVETRRAVTDKHVEELTKEAKGLEEILRNQSHPENLVAIKRSGTPILVSPTEGAKVMFLATAEDEFEMLDMSASWVHIRISGLSRGWVRRANVEMPDSQPVTAEIAVQPAAKAVSDVQAPPFKIETEEIASFPGDWAPLQGKTVKIVSVQKSNENATIATSKTKLDYVKSLFDREYVELTKSSTTAAGVVVVFDSADGGMLAATLPVLQQWKSGTLSDEALWRRCYIDPPEMFNVSSAR